MTIVLTGRDLTLAQVIDVAREGARVALDDGARERMAQSRALAQRVFESGVPTYGLTTGFGAQKRVAVTAEDVSRFNRSQIQDHRAGQGPPATDDVVRAAMLCLANLFAGGTTVARPELADALIAALNEDRHPIVRLHGSIGVSDLSAMADLAHGVIGDMDLRAGEALALTNNSAFGTASAALALHDAARLLDAADVAGALALEGFGANLSVLHPGVEKTRPHPSFAAASARTRALLEGSYLWGDGAARNLQDPLTFRSTVAVQAVGREALDHALARPRDRAQRGPGQPARGRRDGADRLGGELRVPAARRRPGLRARRPGLGVHRGQRALRQAPRHAVVGTADRAQRRPRPPGPRPEHPRDHRPGADCGGQPAGAAGVVHRRQHVRRGGHRGPRHAAAAERAASRRHGGPRRGRDRRRGARRGAGRSTCAAAARSAAAPRRRTPWSARGSRSPARAVARSRTRVCCAGSCARRRSRGPKRRMPGESRPRRPSWRRAHGCYPCGMDHVSLSTAHRAVARSLGPPIRR